MALAADRDTPARIGDVRIGPVAASVRIFAGALLMRNAAGHLTRGATATGTIGVGRAEAAVDSTSGAAAAVNVSWKAGIFRFRNSTAGDAITIADIGTRCFIVDDDTVARTNGSSTRFPAGPVEDVDSAGVRVRFDEALTRAA